MASNVSWAVLLCFGVICLIPAVYFWAVRLEWTDETLVLRAGPWRRSVSLTSLTCLGYKRSGRTGVYLLEDGFGRSLRVDVSGFGRDDVWKRHLLQSAHRSGAQISPKAEESLRHASGTGRGYLA